MTNGQSSANRSRRIAVSVLCLVLFAAIGTGLISMTETLTRETIAENRAAQAMKVLQSLLPENGFDNVPDQDVILVIDPDLLGTDEAVPVYRARNGGQAVTAIITTFAPTGYVGPIKLLVGVDINGRITGVRAVEHRETPGLGDRIDHDKSAWVDLFVAASIGDPAPDGWLTRRDGGDFDQITGATITSRAIIQAVRDALQFFDENTELVFSAPTEAVSP